MDKAAKRKYCSLLMFDVPTPSFIKSSDRTVPPTQLTIDYTTSLENSNIRTQDNFIFTSFLECMKVNPQRPHKNAPISSFEQDSSNNNEAIKSPLHKEERIRRPPNSFLLYRQAKQSEITSIYGNMSNAEISKKLSDLWQNESDEVKLYWQKVADKKKMEHMMTYPEYVYRPKSGTKPNKKKRKLKTESNQFQNTLPRTQTSYVNMFTFPSQPFITPTFPYLSDQFEIPNPPVLPSIFPKEYR
ncbi:16940_t:CDS:2 [Cetraspora pellucida]|uniref:16940_t:CDS:1 n=1 Tax=Cetraspora pellucida TaxID=1433469 RepID=A0A9N8Z6L1_9GLOM|nr:16940_t:CDS:2 [Cetraspora pellucida]